MNSQQIGVLELSTVFAIGGSERQVANLVRGLDRNSFEVHVGCLRKVGQLLSEVELDRPVEEWPVGPLWGMRAMRERVKLIRFLNQNEIGVVHCHGLYPDLFAVPIRPFVRRTAIIASVRDCGFGRSTAKSAALMAACRLADRVVVNARVVRDRLVASGVPEKQIVVIPNGVDLDRFPPRQHRPDLREELGVPAQAPLVAVVARLDPVKGLEHFIDAAALLAPRVPAARFLIVGGEGAMAAGKLVEKNDYRDQLRLRAERLGIADRVFFSGFREDVPELLGDVSVSVLSSLSEAMPNSLLEAMAAGAPAVATAVGGVSEAVQDGFNGLLVPPADPGAMANAVERLLTDEVLARRLADAASNTVRDRFSLGRMVEETQGLYRELGEKRARPVRPGKRVRVETVVDQAGLDRLAPEWDELAEKAGLDHPFLTHAWTATWLECLGAGRKLEIAVARAGREAIAIAPLARDGGRLLGVPVRRLAFVADVHTPMFDVLAADRKEEAFTVLVEKLAADRNRWDVAQLSQIPLESPTLEMLPRLAREAGLEAGIWNAPAAPYVSMAGGWDRYLASLSSGHRGNLRNRRRRLEAMGPVTMETVSQGDLATALDDGFRIEAAAWKGANATAISSQPEVAKFYRRLAERASKLGWLDLKFLNVGGRRVAFAYSLLFKKRLFVLKEGYDPLYADGSPFLLLFGMMLEDAHRRGLESVELLGEEEPWKARWTSTAREHRWLFLFGDRHRARLLHALKFGVLPRLRATMTEAAV